MKLEEEIKQAKFQDEWQKALLNIMYTGNWLTDNFMVISKKYAINDQHYNILRILRGKYPNCICPGEIKEVLVNKRGDLTRLLDKLVKMELVDRNINAENRRMVDVIITQKGLNLLAEMDPDVNQVENIKAHISEEDAKVLNDILDKIRG
ncbi:MarR family transcriptional regulator [Reichenbachiella sp. MALMAid0571]|uniref:MarR family winged helix-turn-helix transcriptional regulator n=1 Tax=Reichenbachiella sp. MALMAid0571 TaxID=3143939 RepID=UPI0032DF1710